MIMWAEPAPPVRGRHRRPKRSRAGAIIAALADLAARGRPVAEPAMPRRR